MKSDSKSNIKFNYLYRDAGNYKVWGFEIFENSNLLSLDIIEPAIRTSLIDGEFFDPKFWKVRQLKHEDWVPELDHTWNEFESIEYTNQEPTISVSIDQFLSNISKIPKYW